jgi:SAM-dependent methyltransferase
MTNESTRVSSCILNPVSLTETHPWQFEDETPAIVKDYFKAVGIMEVLSDDEFAQAAFKACSLERAIAVCSRLDGTRHETYFSWLAQTNLPEPNRILDVGCNIGITTCFYAMLYPQATITGIDSRSVHIESAKELAARLQLKNVKFIEASVRRPPADLKNQKFDLVFSNDAANDLMADPPYLARSIEDIASETDRSVTEHVRTLAGFLADDRSKLVSFEDFYTPHYLACWLWDLRDVGIYVPYKDAEILYFFNSAYRFDDCRTVMVGSRQPTTLPTPEEIRSLWTCGLDEIPEQDVYEDIEAESMFVASEPKELHHRTEHYEGEDWFFRELWESGSHVLIYKYYDRERKLVRLPAENPKPLIELLVEAFDDKEDDAEDA